MPTRLNDKTDLLSARAAAPAFQEPAGHAQEINVKGGIPTSGPLTGMPAKMQRDIAMHAAAARWRERRTQ